MNAEELRAYLWTSSTRAGLRPPRAEFHLPGQHEQQSHNWRDRIVDEGSKQSKWYDKHPDYEKIKGITRPEGDALHQYRQNSAHINDVLRAGKEYVKSESGAYDENWLHRTPEQLVPEAVREEWQERAAEIATLHKQLQKSEDEERKARMALASLKGQGPIKTRGSREQIAEAKARYDAAAAENEAMNNKFNSASEAFDEWARGALEKHGAFNAVALIDSALGKVKFPRDAVLFRGLNRGFLPKNLRKGAVVEDRGFGSWSIDGMSALEFGDRHTLLVTELNKGDHAIALRHKGSDANDEAEVLLPRNQRYRVTEVHDIDFDGNPLRLVVLEPARKGKR